MSTEAWTAVGTGLAAIAALISAIIGLLVGRWQISLGKEQESLQQKLATEQRLFQKSLAENEALLQTKISEREEKLNQRAQLIPIWSYLIGVRQINPQNPVPKQVVDTANTLELVATCCEAEIIDPDVVKRTFRNTYITLYEQIEQVQNIEGWDMSGKKLLSEKPAAQDWYKKFKDQIVNETKIGRF
jgi:hypothetical protein